MSLYPEACKCPRPAGFDLEPVFLCRCPLTPARYLSEPESKLLVSPSISPIVVPYAILYIIPFLEFRS